MKYDVHSAECRTGSIDRSHESSYAPIRLPRLTPRPSEESGEGHDDCMDERILDQVRRALHHCGYEQLRRLRARCRHGCVVLHGSIPTYYLKQVAQEIIRTVSDVRSIANNLRVVRAAPSPKN